MRFLPHFICGLVVLTVAMLAAPAWAGFPAAYAIGRDGRLYYTEAPKDKPTYIDVVSRPKPETYRVTNKTSGTIVVKLYKGTDRVRMISFKKFTLNKGRSATFPARTVHVKVYKPRKLADKRTGKQLNLLGDITITGTPDRPRITAPGRPATTFRNLTTEKLTIRIYKSTDKIRAIAREKIRLAPGATHTWRSPLDRFWVKASRDRLFDKKLARELADSGATITFRQSRFARWTKLETKNNPDVDGGLTGGRHHWAGGDGNWPFSLAGVTANGAPRYLMFIHDKRGFKRYGGDWRTQDNGRVFPNGALDTAPASHMGAKRAAGGKIASDAVLHITRDEKVEYREVYKKNFGADLNDGAWKDTGIRTNKRVATLRNMLFATTTEGKLVTATYDKENSCYGAVTELGSDFASAPAARISVDTDGEIVHEVYAVGTDGKIRYRQWVRETERWGPMKTMDGDGFTNVAVAGASGFKALGLGRFKHEQFVLGMNRDGRIMSNHRPDTGEFKGWELFDNRTFKAGFVALEVGD